MIRSFAAAVLWLLLAGCTAPGGTVETAGSVGVDRYCEKFAKAYLERNAIAYTGLFVRTDKKTDLMKWFSNVFSPSDSRFTAGYDCKFTAHSGEGRTRSFSVAIFLTATEEFAYYTKWENLQIIPVGYVVDEIHGRAGFGVFKYLKARSQNLQ